MWSNQVRYNQICFAPKPWNVPGLEQMHRLNRVLVNSADPDEMPHYAAFHLGGFTVCVSTHLGVSRLQRVKVGWSVGDFPDQFTLPV